MKTFIVFIDVMQCCNKLESCEILSICIRIIISYYSWIKHIHFFYKVRKKFWHSASIRYFLKPTFIFVCTSHYLWKHTWYNNGLKIASVSRNEYCAVCGQKDLPKMKKHCLWVRCISPYENLKNIPRSWNKKLYILKNGYLFHLRFSGTAVSGGFMWTVSTFPFQPRKTTGSVCSVMLADTLFLWVLGTP